MWNFKERPELPNTQFEFYYLASPHKQITEDFWGKVVKVVDGDTIRVTMSERDFDFPIRLLGINAPEMNEPRGKEVQQWLEKEVLNSTIYVEIDIDQRVGKWGRLLGKIIHNGLDMGDTMIRLGMATSFETRNEGKIPNINKIMAGFMKDGF